VYFPLDEGNGNRLNNSGSVLLPALVRTTAPNGRRLPPGK
jgi:hypothetical protein